MEALRASELRYRRLFESAKDGILILDAETGMIVDVNPFLVELLGISRETFLHKKIWELGFFKDIVANEDKFYELRAQEYIRYEDLPLESFDGRSIAVEFVSNVYLVNDHRVIQCNIRDITERKRAEEALRQVSVRYEAILSEIPDIVVAVDRNMVYTWANSIALEFFGNDVIGKKANDYFVGEQDTRERVQPLFAGDSATFYLESWQRRKDGQRRLLAWWCRALKDASGIVNGALSTARDITDHKQAEETLNASSRLIEGIINAIPVRVFWKDRNLVYLGCNAIFARDAGFADPKDIIGKDDFQMGWRDRADMYRSDDRQVIESGGSKYLVEELLTTAEGDTLTILTSKIPLRSSTGEINGVLGTYMDITERKQAEESLRVSEERFRRIFQHSASGMVLVSPDFHFLQVNDGFCRMLGYTESELLGKTFQDVTHPEDRPVGGELVRRVLSGEMETFQLEKRYLRKDGTVVWGLASSTLIRDAQNKPLYFVTQIQDLTERKVAEEQKRLLEGQFIQAQKMESVGRLAGGVAHDFNNMLGVILGHAELAIQEVDPEQPLHDNLKEIHKAAVRSADLTRQLLAFARKQTVAPRVLDLNQTVTNALKMLQRLIGEDINIKWHPVESLWQTKIDPSQIDQILANLCVNARDAIKSGGKITIETENSTLDKDYCAAHIGSVPGEYVTLTVSDDGCGMDKETLAQIFEPFFTTKGIGEGTGLGLSTVYGIVKQNNGFINAYSEMGYGTTFTIYLPRHEGKASQAAGTVGSAEPRMHGHETILLVEDDPSLLKLTARMIEKQGYTVLVASTPGEALHLTDEYGDKIRLLMTDVVMPGMNGRDLAKNLMDLIPNLKLLFMSGYTADVIAHNGVLDEGVHFIQKPFSVQSLAIKLREVLDSV